MSQSYIFLFSHIENPRSQMTLGMIELEMSCNYALWQCTVTVSEYK